MKRRRIHKEIKGGEKKEERDFRCVCVCGRDNGRGRGKMKEREGQRSALISQP